MATQLKVIHEDKAKEGKSSAKTQEAIDDLPYLLSFNQSITFAMARTVQDLCDFVFVDMTNITLARRDSYLDHLKSVMKRDTLAAIRNSPLHMFYLFSDSVINEAKEESGH